MGARRVVDPVMYGMSPGTKLAPPVQQFLAHLPQGTRITDEQQQVLMELQDMMMMVQAPNGEVQRPPHRQRIRQPPAPSVVLVRPGRHKHDASPRKYRTEYRGGGKPEKIGRDSAGDPRSQRQRRQVPPLGPPAAPDVSDPRKHGTPPGTYHSVPLGLIKPDQHMEYPAGDLRAQDRRQRPQQQQPAALGGSKTRNHGMPRGKHDMPQEQKARKQPEQSMKVPAEDPHAQQRGSLRTQKPPPRAAAPAAAPVATAFDMNPGTQVTPQLQQVIQQQEQLHQQMVQGIQEGQSY